MNSLVDCEKLKKDLKGLLVDGDNMGSMENVNYLFDYISHLDNPIGVIEHINEFKVDGNSFFKKGEVNDALEKYGFGGLFLSCLNTKEEGDKITFFSLVKSILLNMTACFLKKEDFWQAGHVCTIVVDYNPGNIKVLYRRACAAIELGRYELAYLDFELACEHEPYNQEVIKQLDKVKRFLQINSPNQDKGRDALTFDTHSSINNSSIGLIVDEKGKENNYHERKPHKDVCENRAMVKLDEVESMNQDEKGKNDTLKEVISSVEGMGTDNGAQVTHTEKKDVVIKDVENKKVNVSGVSTLKPMVHFYNKKRSGSSLSISKRDYQKLAQGKPVQHFNPRTGVVMSIKLKDPPKKATVKVREDPVTHKSSTSIPHKWKQEKEVDNMNQDIEELHTEVMVIVDPICKPDGDSVVHASFTQDSKELMIQQAIKDAPILPHCPMHVTSIDQSPYFQSIAAENSSFPFQQFTTGTVILLRGSEIEFERGVFLRIEESNSRTQLVFKLTMCFNAGLRLKRQPSFASISHQAVKVLSMRYEKEIKLPPKSRCGLTTKEICDCYE